MPSRTSLTRDTRQWRESNPREPLCRRLPGLSVTPSRTTGNKQGGGPTPGGGGVPASVPHPGARRVTRGVFRRGHFDGSAVAPLSALAHSHVVTLS